VTPVGLAAEPAVGVHMPLLNVCVGLAALGVHIPLLGACAALDPSAGDGLGSEPGAVEEEAPSVGIAPESESVLVGAAAGPESVSPTVPVLAEVTGEESTSDVDTEVDAAFADPVSEAVAEESPLKEVSVGAGVAPAGPVPTEVGGEESPSEGAGVWSGAPAVSEAVEEESLPVGEAEPESVLPAGLVPEPVDPSVGKADPLTAEIQAEFASGYSQLITPALHPFAFAWLTH